MYDLLYAAPKHQDTIRSAFPHAMIEDASDDVHNERFSVELPEEERKDYEFLLWQTGLAGASLSIGLALCHAQGTG